MWQETEDGTVTEKARIASFYNYEYNGNTVQRFDISSIMFKEMDQEYYMAIYNSEGEQISSKLKYSIGAYCSETIDVYVANDLAPVGQHLDEDEFIDVQAFDVETLRTMIFHGELQDAKTVAGVTAYKAFSTSWQL